jgi:hypothetical protein
MAAMASQNPPAPTPSSKRPRESTSSEAAAFASIAGPRSGTLVTFGKTLILVVSASNVAINIQVSRNRHW